MSYWHEPKLDDLSLSSDGTELHAYIGDDESGAIYASIKIEDIKKVLKTKPKKEEPKQLKLL